MRTWLSVLGFVVVACGGATHPSAERAAAERPETQSNATAPQVAVALVEAMPVVEPPPVAAATPTQTAATEAEPIPEWVKPYAQTLAALGEMEIDHIELEDNLAFVMLGSNAWLCWLRDTQACFAWPTTLAFKAVIYAFDEGGEARAMLAEPGLQHEVRIVQRGEVMRVTHQSSRRDVVGSPEYTKPPSRGRKSPRRPSLWKHGKLVLRGDTATQAQRVLALLAQFTSAAEDSTKIKLSITRAHESVLATFIKEEVASHGDAWLCLQVRGSKRHCWKSEANVIDVLRVPGAATSGWLLQEDWFEDRGGSSTLVYVDAGGWHATINIGNLGGYGEHCGFADSYCVWCDAVWVPFELLGERCIGVDPPLRWSAIHVRGGDRWVDEKVEPRAADDPTVRRTLQATPQGWVQADCGARP